MSQSSTGAEALKLEIETQRQKIKEMRKHLNDLIQRAREARKEEKKQKIRDRMKQASFKFSGAWQELIEKGMAEREVIAVQNLDAKLKDLGEIFGTSAGRARQIRDKAKRRMRSPSFWDTTKKLGLCEKVCGGSWPFDSPP